MKQPETNETSNPPATRAGRFGGVPATVRNAGILAIVQCSIALIYAAVLIVREIMGKRDPSAVFADESRAGLLGYGTAIFIIIIFGAVLAGAINMMMGRKWGRGPVVMLEMFMLVMAFYLFGADQFLWAAVVAASGAAGLAMLFNSTALGWATATHS